MSAPGDSEETFRLHDFVFYGKAKDDSAYWVYGLNIRCTLSDAPTYAEQLSHIHRTSVYYITPGLKGVAVYGERPFG